MPADEEESELAESNGLALLDDIRSEFQIDKDGKAFASRRAIARLQHTYRHIIIQFSRFGAIAFPESP